MQDLYLHGNAALDVFEAEITGCRVAWIDDVEEVGVSVVIKEIKGRSLLPMEKEIRIEVCRWVTFNRGERWMRSEVELILGG